MNVGEDDDVTRVMTSRAIVETHAALDAERQRLAAAGAAVTRPRRPSPAPLSKEQPPALTAPAAPREEEREALAVYDRPVATLAFADAVLERPAPAEGPVSSRIDGGLTPEPFSAPITDRTRVDPLAAAAQLARAAGPALAPATRADAAQLRPAMPSPPPASVPAPVVRPQPATVLEVTAPPSSPRWKRHRGPPRGLLIGLTAAALAVSVLAVVVLRRPAAQTHSAAVRAAPSAAVQEPASAMTSARPRETIPPETPVAQLPVAALPIAPPTDEPVTKKKRRVRAAAAPAAPMAHKPPALTPTSGATGASPDGLDAPAAPAESPAPTSATAPPAAAAAAAPDGPAQPARGSSALEDPGF